MSQRLDSERQQPLCDVAALYNASLCVVQIILIKDRHSANQEAPGNKDITFREYYGHRTVALNCVFMEEDPVGNWALSA